MAHDDQCCSWDEDGNPEVCMGPPKEEPDCYTCNDSGRILSFPSGTDMVIDENCPDCNPTEEQHAANLARAEAAQAEYELRVAAGEITFTEAPF